jgi:hypothetical protein
MFDQSYEQMMVFMLVDTNANCSLVLLANGHYGTHTYLWNDAHIHPFDVPRCSAGEGM